MGAKRKERDPQALLVDMLLQKAGMKQDVHARTKETFLLLKEQLEALTAHVGTALAAQDPRLEVVYTTQGELSAKAEMAGDAVIFSMHTNVFRLDQSHTLWKGSYLQEDADRGYFGVINIYNFLSDSFHFNRERDLGYLVARLFLNKEGHFFAQGKKQLGFLYNDLATSPMDASAMKAFLTSVLLYVLDFDLLAPPYDQVSQVTVEEIKQVEARSLLATGKRLGFRFQADSDEIT